MRFLHSAEKKQLKPVKRELHLSTAKPMTGGYRPWSKFNAHSWSNLNARRHPVLKRLFGFKRMANFNAVIRLFNKFTQA